MTLKHRPASHPLMQRQRMLSIGQILAAIDSGGRALDPSSAVSLSDQGARIEDLAQRVVLMPDSPLTAQQRRSLVVIAHELLRRADSPTTRRS